LFSRRGRSGRRRRRGTAGRSAAGVADHGHHQRAPAALLLDVDGDAEVDAAVVDDVRLAVDLGEVASP
jgi:hypothetical protein